MIFFLGAVLCVMPPGHFSVTGLDRRLPPGGGFLSPHCLRLHPCPAEPSPGDTIFRLQLFFFLGGGGQGLPREAQRFGVP